MHLALEERTATIVKHYKSIEAHVENIRVLDQRPPEARYRTGLLEATMRELRPALVVVDPLFKWAKIADGNDYAQVVAALEPYEAIARENRCHLCFLHHAKKAGGNHGSEAAGSTALQGAVDSFISIKRQGSQRWFYAEGREGIDVDDTLLVLEPDGWIRAGQAKAAADESETAAQVLAYLEESGESLDGKQVAKGMGIRRETAFKALKALAERGKAFVSKEGNRKLYSTSVPVPTPREREPEPTLFND